MTYDSDVAVLLALDSVRCTVYSEGDLKEWPVAVVEGVGLDPKLPHPAFPVTAVNGEWWDRNVIIMGGDIRN